MSNAVPSPSSTPGHSRADRPHVVLVVVDDLGWRDLGCTGSDFYETPAIDRLAAEGALFEQAYAGSPVCSPTRASIMTGKSPARVGVTNYIGGHNVGRLTDTPSVQCLPRNEFSLARAMRAGGYRTIHVGKWHLGKSDTWPEQHGFDVNVGGCEWGHPRSYWSPYECPTLSDGPEGEYLTDRLTDEAIASIRAAVQEEVPFFLNLWHYAVHTPLVAPPELVAKYEEKARRLGRDDSTDVLEGEEMPHWLPSPTRVRRRIRQGDPTYAAMVENLDTNIGRLVDELERLGILDDTIVVFTSDNGGLHSSPSAPTANLPLAEGKGWTEEGGIRVPLLVRHPASAPAGATRRTPVISADLYPTLLSLCGLDPRPEQHVDGVDVSGVIACDELADRALHWHFPHYSHGGSTPASAIRRGSWKLTRDYETGRTVLCDLAVDPGEEGDLSADHPDVVTELDELLDRWLDDVEGRVPRPNRAPFDEYAR